MAVWIYLGMSSGKLAALAGLAFAIIGHRFASNAILGFKKKRNRF
jgi:hypothetical protein